MGNDVFGLGVVIQGPVRSRTFDAAPTIEANIRAYSAHRDVRGIVVSTWDGELAEQAARCWTSMGNVAVLENRPVLGFDFLNRQKQFVSTHEGVKYVRNNLTATHVIKLRSDQEVPVEIVDFMRRFYTSDPSHAPASALRLFQQPLLFSYVNRTVPFHIGDFYFAGRVDDMIHLMANCTSYGDRYLQGAVEVDLVLKHLERSDPDFAKHIPWWVWTGQMCIARKYPRDHGVWKYWLQVYRDWFATFPRHILQETTWRGVPLAQSLLAHGPRAQMVMDKFFDYHDEWQMLRDHADAYLALPLDVQIDPVRYAWDAWMFVKRSASEFQRRGHQAIAERKAGLRQRARETLQTLRRRRTGR